MQSFLFVAIQITSDALKQLLLGTMWLLKNVDQLAQLTNMTEKDSW
jgi:hypothetical protein